MRSRRTQSPQPSFRVQASIFVILAFALWACTRETRPQKPAFVFGSKVFVPEGFYRGSKGRVLRVGWDVRDATWTCEIAANLVSPDLKFKRLEDLSFRCRELLEDASDGEF